MAVLLQTRFCGGFPKLFSIVSDSTQCCMNCRHLSPLHLQSAEIDQSCRRCWGIICFIFAILQYSNYPITVKLVESNGGLTHWHNGSLIPFSSLFEGRWFPFFRSITIEMLWISPCRWCLSLTGGRFWVGFLLRPCLELRKGLQYKSLTRSKGAIWKLADENLWWMGLNNSRWWIFLSQRGQTKSCKIHQNPINSIFNISKILVPIYF